MNGNREISRTEKRIGSGKNAKKHVNGNRAIQ
jgi:hypothetical protein